MATNWAAAWPRDEAAIPRNAPLYVGIKPLLKRHASVYISPWQTLSDGEGACLLSQTERDVRAAGRMLGKTYGLTVSSVQRFPQGFAIFVNR